MRSTLIKSNYILTFSLFIFFISNSVLLHAETPGPCDLKVVGGEIVSYRSCDELILTTKDCVAGMPLNYLSFDEGVGTQETTLNLCSGDVQFVGQYDTKNLAVYLGEGSCKRGLKPYGAADIEIGIFEGLKTYRACIPETIHVYQQLRYSANARPIIRFYEGNVCPKGLTAEVFLENWSGDEKEVVGCAPSN